MVPARKCNHKEETDLKNQNLEKKLGTTPKTSEKFGSINK